MQWLSGATKVQRNDAGSFIPGKPKIVLHTTEGSTAAAAISALDNAQAWPHFLISPKTGQVWQFIALDKTAKALEHPAGTPPTNADNCIQIEIVGFAGTSHSWPRSYLRSIAKLCYWIEQNAGVPHAHCTVHFTDANHVKRLSASAFHSYTGYLGHQHVPNQPSGHWDPGHINWPALSRHIERARKIDKFERELGELRAEAAKDGWTLARRFRGRVLKGNIARLSLL